MALGEFGRTPKINSNAGRDHWPDCYSVLLAGGGVRGGMKYGETDEFGYYVAKNKVSIPDLPATILHLMGIDAHTTIPDRQDRPVPVVGTGVLRPEIFRGA